MGAIQTIIVADFVMSLDNALAIAAAAKGSMFLVIFGLVLSVPIIIGGSAIILRIWNVSPLLSHSGLACLAGLAAA
jgi:predicted tellurium resistance membrane protein TerC